MVAHYPADGSISTFEVPSDLPSGKYILHWWWRGAFIPLVSLATSDLSLRLGYYCLCDDTDIVVLLGLLQLR